MLSDSGDAFIFKSGIYYESDETYELRNLMLPLKQPIRLDLSKPQSAKVDEIPFSCVMPDEYSPETLRLINIVRSEHHLHSLLQSQTTPATFRRLIRHGALLGRKTLVNREQANPLKSLAVYQAFEQLPASLHPEIGGRLASMQHLEGETWQLKVLKIGLSMTIDRLDFLTKGDVNAISRLYDTTSREYFFALITNNGEIECHASSLICLVQEFPSSF